MSNHVEMAQETMEHAHHQAAHAGHAVAPRARAAAILVAIFAAIAVIIEMGANDAQTTYLARIVTASDVWNEYQAKSVRRTIWNEAADAMLATGPNTPAAAATIAKSRADAARMEDDPQGSGMKQLAARAQANEHARDHAYHLREQLERSVRVLQIAVVLTGLYLATQVDALVVIGLVIGIGAIVYGAITGLGLI